MGVSVREFHDAAILDLKSISESIRSLGIITCDVCKKSKASHDVFVPGVEGVAFLRRCCDECLKSFNGFQ
ncbi:MAG TPA: hypothetical protein VJ742_09230 [Nitrososphaera sp.]|jgi:hypothetical protein|nr:hypothetical protein [Nitrososphaera sp.]